MDRSDNGHLPIDRRTGMSSHWYLTAVEMMLMSEVVELMAVDTPYPSSLIFSHSSQRNRLSLQAKSK